MATLRVKEPNTADLRVDAPAEDGGAFGSGGSEENDT